MEINEKKIPFKERKKSKKVAGLLGIFLGAFGIHNFYLGKFVRGVLEVLFTIYVMATSEDFFQFYCVITVTTGLLGFIKGCLILGNVIDVNKNYRLKHASKEENIEYATLALKKFKGNDKSNFVDYISKRTPLSATDIKEIINTEQAKTDKKNEEMEELKKQLEQEKIDKKKQEIELSKKFIPSEPKKQENQITEDNKATYQSVKEPNNENYSLRTAQDMYNYCLQNNFGSGMSAAWDLKHFALIENALQKNEKVYLCFEGLHNYISASKHDGNFAFALTNKRIIMAQKRMMGEAIQSVYLENLNDVSYKKGLLFGVISIDTTKEFFNVGVNSVTAQCIINALHEKIDEIKSNNGKTNGDSNISVSNELKTLKELFDSGILTQEEFDKQKAKLLK